MNNRRINFLLALLLLMSFELFPMETKIFSKIEDNVFRFEKLQEIVAKELKDETNPLIVLDVDDTLITNGIFDEVLDLIYKNHDPKSELFVSCTTSVLKNSSATPVNEKQIGWVNDLQKKYNVICLTHNSTGPFGDIEKLEEVKYNNVCSVGYNIKNPFKNFQDNLPIKIGQLSYLYYNGIIFTNDFDDKTVFSLTNNKNEKENLSDKGLVFTDFLGTLDDKGIPLPSKVIFIDDKIEYVKSVSKAMKFSGIPCTAIEYTFKQDHLSMLKRQNLFDFDEKAVAVYAKLIKDKK